MKWSEVVLHYLALCGKEKCEERNSKHFMTKKDDIYRTPCVFIKSSKNNRL